MTEPALPPPGPSRRRLLAGAAGLALARPAIAQPARSVSFLSWTAALDQLREHGAGFTEATGLRVAHQHVPWATYRSTALNRLSSGASPDVLWVADTNLAEFAALGLIAPIDDLPELTRFNAEALPFCTQTMTLQGRQYGLGYYTDHIALLYNRALLDRAGIPRPPETWDELVQQCQSMQTQGLSGQPLAIPLASDPWLIEIIIAMLASFGGMRPVPPGLVGPGDSDRPMRATLTFLHDAIHRYLIMSPDALDMNEDSVFRGFADGHQAFTLLPSYRLIRLNDWAQAKAAGSFRAALMPNGDGATGHYSQGWLRFYAMSAAAKSVPLRRAAASEFMAAFGGRDWTGAYRLQKNLLLDLGLPSCALPLADDPAVRRYDAGAEGSGAILREQRLRLRAKSVWAPWYASWQAATNEVWREAIAGRIAATDAVELSRVAWRQLESGWRSSGR
jgi:multiple sugar transport system substrate-binding protein